ncbi:MAG: chaperone modulator CbpM [Gammaproteobacteria bacterium]|nr:chaperone modulator CbpM [Gammaproteobacteria bacterium]NNJ94632.1 MerR family transcriptional regulator [Halobacteria archaeon]
MTDDLESLLNGELLEEDVELSLAELCQACRVPAEQIVELVGEGIIEPVGQGQVHWRFRAISVRRVRCALRLQHDLGVNTAGAALALDLLEELAQLRARRR